MNIGRILVTVSFALIAGAALASDTCHEYSWRAVSLDNVEIETLCRSTHISDQATHERNCKQIGIVPSRVVETQRIENLKACYRRLPDATNCLSYVTQAIMASRAQGLLDCQYSGERWSQNWDAHSNFCYAQGFDHTYLISETQARRDSIISCLGRFQPPR